MSTKVRCQKYDQDVDIEQNPCPHPLDYCKYRSRCIVNRLCSENADCRKKRRKAVENTG